MADDKSNDVPKCEGGDEPLIAVTVSLGFNGAEPCVIENWLVRPDVLETQEQQRAAFLKIRALLDSLGFGIYKMTDHGVVVFDAFAGVDNVTPAVGVRH